VAKEAIQAMYMLHVFSYMVLREVGTKYWVCIVRFCHLVISMQSKLGVPHAVEWFFCLNMAT
jgi:hypothetical protein